MGTLTPPPAASLCPALASYLYTDPSITAWAPTAGLGPFTCVLPALNVTSDDGRVITVTFTVCATRGTTSGWLTGVIDNPVSQSVAVFLGYNITCNIYIISSDSLVAQPYTWGATCSVGVPGYLTSALLVCAC